MHLYLEEDGLKEGLLPNKALKSDEAKDYDSSADDPISLKGEGKDRPEAEPEAGSKAGNNLLDGNIGFS